MSKRKRILPKRIFPQTQLRQYALIRYAWDGPPDPFTKDGVYVYLGEIPNMPGHCVLADHYTGKIYSGYHCSNFSEIPDDET